MKQIDEKVKEIQEFNNRNFKIEEEYLEMFEDIFERFDEEIVSAPFV